MNPWQLYHAYNSLVNQDILPPITHPGCDVSLPLVAQIKTSDPDVFYLWCVGCGTWTKPGLSSLRSMESAVKEFVDVRLVL